MSEKLLMIAQLQERIEQMSALDSVVFTDVAKVARTVTHSDRSSLFLYHKESDALESYIAQGLLTKIYIGMGEGIAGKCAQQKAIIIENDVDASNHFDASVDLGSGYVTQSTIAVPILSPQSELLGVIQLLNKENECYDEVDEELLTTIAHITARYLLHKVH